MICPTCEVVDPYTGVRIDGENGWWPCPLSDDCPCTTWKLSNLETIQ